jgi:hypothetical protein
MNFTVSLKVTGKQGLLIPIQYTGAEQKDLDQIVPALKAAVKKILGHDGHKNLDKPTDIVGNLTLPAGTGSWTVVIALDGTGKDDFSVTWPKAEKASTIKLENAILKLGLELNGA